MAVTSREPEAAVARTGSRKDRRHAVGRRRLRLFMQVVSVALAFVGALSLLLSGGFTVQQGVIDEAVPSPLPSVIENVVSPANAEPESEPGFDVGALEDRLQEIAGEHQGIYGVALLEPESNTRLSLRGDEEFVAASIGKLPPFAALYRAAARGELALDEEISIQSKDYQTYGSGSLHAYPVGHTLTLRDTAYYLVNHSDNTAWAMLDRRLGEAKIKTELEEMGIKDSRYEGYDSGYYTTPDDVLLLMQKISDPTFTSREYSNEMLDAMTDTVFEDRIPEKLPSDVRVAHKIGSYGVSFGDAGVVFYKDREGTEKRYYLVVLSEGAGEYEARETIQEMSLAVYEALTGTQVDPGWSRGKEIQLETKVDDSASSVTPPASKTGGREGNAGSASKSSPLQEKPSVKTEKQPPAIRYDSYFYPPPGYASTYYGRESEGWGDYYESYQDEPYWQEY